MKMNKILSAVFLGISLIISQSVFAKTESTVNTTEIVQGETIQLTITSDNNDSPQLGDIYNHFDVLGQSQERSFIFDGTQNSAYQKWTLSLKPKDYNNIEIPAIKVGNEQTEAIKLTIAPPPNLNNKYKNDELIQVSQTVLQQDVYVQQSTLLELKIKFHQSILNNIINLNMIPSNIIGAQSTQFSSEETEEVDKNGERFLVLTKLISIIPEKSGQIEITPTILDATISYKGRPLNYQFKSNPIYLEVKPIPNNYPKDAVWLPATSLNISQQWNQNLNNITVGDSLTRNIRITATGIVAEKIEMPAIKQTNGIKVYAGQPNYRNSFNNNEPVAYFTVNYTYVPTASGTITLPEETVTWFNTETKQIEYARLPAQTITVKANPELANAPVIDNAPPPAQTASESDLNNNSISESNQPILSNNNSGNSFYSLLFWQILTLIFFITTLILLIITLILLSKLKKKKADEKINSIEKMIDKEALLRKMKSAANNQDFVSLKQHLDDYLTAEGWMTSRLLTDYPEFKQAFEQLNGILYGQNSTQNWDGTKLIEQLQIIISDKQKQTKKADIPPLYPH